MGSVADIISAPVMATVSAAKGIGKIVDRATTSPSNPLVGALKEQTKQAADLQAQTLAQPKKLQSDDFLARKNAQIDKLRMGLASTMTGAGLTSQSSGKSKLGV
jgi:hypothetical protein